MEQIFFQRKFARFPYKRWFDYVRRNKTNFNRIEESIQNSIRIQIFIKIGWLQNQQDVMEQIFFHRKVAYFPYKCRLDFVSQNLCTQKPKSFVKRIFFFDLHVFWSEFDSEFFGVKIFVVRCMKVFYFLYLIISNLTELHIFERNHSYVST